MLKNSMILWVVLFLAGLSVRSSDGVPITKINYTSGMLQTANMALFRAFTPRAIAHWKIGDSVWSHLQNGTCGNDLNAYLLHDEAQDEDACVLRIGK